MTNIFYKNESLDRQAKYLKISGGDIDLHALHMLSRLTPNLISLVWSGLDQVEFEEPLYWIICKNALKNGRNRLQEIRLWEWEVENSLVGLYLVPSINLSNLTTLHIRNDNEELSDLRTKLAEYLIGACALTSLTLENVVLEFKNLEVIHSNAPNIETLNLL